MNLTNEHRIYIGGLLEWGGNLREKYAKTSLKVCFHVDDELNFGVSVYTREPNFHRLTDNGALGISIFDRKGKPTDELKSSLDNIERYLQTYHENQEAELQKQVIALNAQLLKLRDERAAIRPEPEVKF